MGGRAGRHHGLVGPDVPADPADRARGDGRLPLPLVGSPAFTPSRQSFYDVKATTPFHREIEWLSDTRITTGWADRTFRPNEPVDRNAMAAYLYRLAGSPAFVPATPTHGDVRPGDA